VLSNQKWALFSIGIIYNDLMNVQKRLIHTYYSEQRKLVNYFVWPQKQYRIRHAKFQHNIMYGYFCTSSKLVGFTREIMRE
jgi:hypothetical protein